MKYNASETTDINCINNFSDTLPQLLKVELEAAFPVERPYPQDSSSASQCEHLQGGATHNKTRINTVSLKMTKNVKE